MYLHVLQNAMVILVVLLKDSLGKQCTDGFLNSLNTENYNSSRLGPLLGQNVISGAERWIFPSLQFTCSGRLTKWMFRAANVQATSSQCRINIGTWRLDRRSFSTIYRRLSTTAQKVRITRDGPIFTYEFVSPVKVQPGDIVGVELGSFTCPVFENFDNILRLDIRGTGSSSLSYKQIGTGPTFLVTQDPITSIVPFLQPVLETTTSEEPTTGSPIFTASNSAENTTTVTDPSTSSEVEERTITRSNPLSTTTDDNSALVNTIEPRDELNFIIYIVAGVGTGTIVLLGIVVTCIGLVGIMKCMQARLAKGRQSDTEQPQVVISSSNGTLLQENTAYRKLMNSWSTDTTGSGYETLSTEEGKNSDTEQLQNTSNSKDNMVGYKTTLIKEQGKPESTKPQDSSDSSGIVLQENNAYKKSTKLVGYDATSVVENRDTDVNQCANSTGIVVHKNTAYKKLIIGEDAVMGYETMDEIVEQAMQLNLAYGSQGEPQKEMARVDAGDYEMTTGDSVYDFGNQAHREVDKHSTLAEAVTYDLLIQQQHINPEDSEHSYDYVY